MPKTIILVIFLGLAWGASASQQPGSVSVASATGARTVVKRASAQDNYGKSTAPEYCTPPAVVETKPAGVPIPKMQDGAKPNFIVILTDDQGWDDLGVNNPLYVHTPNLDKFMSRGTRFDNFYVTPQCAQSRAALLTGRMPARVGTMLVHGGYDFINTNEATAAEVMGAAGYNSVHYGKWHNGRTLGYEPWHVGFNDSYLPPMAAAINSSGIVSHNGSYEMTSEFLDEALMSKVLGYLDKAEQDPAKPFYMFYAPHSIHTSRTDGPFKGSAFRLFPEKYRERYSDPRYEKVAKSTIDAWAMLEYLDDVLGKLFDYLDSSPLGKNTYVMIMSDNGPQLLTDERRFQERRIPSKMQGSKSLPDEAGIRNFLAVTGPGVQGGMVDSTLLHLIDVLPTMADLASVPDNAADHKPWEGISFKNLLVPQVNISSIGGTAHAGQQLVSAKQDGGGVQQSSRRGQLLANSKQYNRVVIALSPHCWDSDAVPELDKNREIIRPQPLLDYDTGGVANSVYWGLLKGLKADHPGFQACIAVRHREYKWVGSTGKVYRFTGESHVELPCNEVAEPQASALAQIMSSAARNWWQSIVLNETSSFTKPVYYMGLGNFMVTNILADGAHERTPGNVTLMANGARGFKGVGDRICYKAKVFKDGSYDATLFYTSKQWAVFKLSVGPYQSIADGTAPSLTATLPVMGTMQGTTMGWLNLTASAPADKTEVCLELISAQYPGTAVFDNLSNIRIMRLSNETLSGAKSDSTQSPDGSYGGENLDFGEGEEEAYNDTGDVVADVSGGSGDVADAEDPAGSVAAEPSATVQAAAAQAQPSPANISSRKVTPGGQAAPASTVKKPAVAAPKKPAAAPSQKPAAAAGVQKPVAAAAAATAGKQPAAGTANKPPQGPPAKKPAVAPAVAKRPRTGQQVQQQKKVEPKAPARQQAASTRATASFVATASTISTHPAKAVTSAAAVASVPEPEDEVIAVPKDRRGRSGIATQAPVATASVPSQPVPSSQASAPVQPAPAPVLLPPAGLDTKGAPVAQPAAAALTPENLGQYRWMFADGLRASEENQESGARPDMGAVIAALRERYHWPKGQGTMESMFSPYDAEDIHMCEACKPKV